MSHLFDSFTLRGVTLKNRIAVSPMCQYWSEDGFASDWHLVHLGARAIGGAALVMTEATAVEERGRITPGCVGIWKDEHIEPWSRVTKFLKTHGAVPGIQLAHAGRKASVSRPWEGDSHLKDEEGGWETIAPSPKEIGGSNNRLWKIPREMTNNDIEEVKEAWVQAIKRAHAAGFEWVEIHFAHGYLAHQFLSPLANFRTDAYGGDLENRMRFALETIRAMKKEWPEDKPFTVRISAADWVEGGLTVEESVIFCRCLKQAGVDLIDCSSGFTSVDSVRHLIGPGWQVPLAARIKKEAEIATGAVGLITSPAQADQIIRNGQADLIFLATAMLNDPHWPFHAAKELGKLDTFQFPPPYDYVLRNRRAS